MEDKHNNEADGFKKILRDKIVDKPTTSPSDHILWQNVMAEISAENKPVKSLKQFYWYASAAVLLMTVTLSYLFVKNNETAVSTHVATNTGHKRKQDVRSSTNIPSDQKSEDTIKSKQPATKNTPASQGEPQPSFTATETVLQQVLDDKSTVTLNTHSSFKVLSTFQKTREIAVNGEAYFEVTPNKAAPFVVHFGDYRVQVVGTKFNIRSYDAENVKEVTVTEGLVKVFENNERTILVKAGEQLKLSKQADPLLTQVEAINFISWKTHSLDFKRSRLEDVAEILSRLHHQQIHVDKPMKDCIFSGDLTQLKLDEALEVLKVTSSLKIEKKQHVIHLSGYGCN